MIFSIITINRNNKDGLIKTIESVVNQTCEDYEYIIVDGNSTDGSREIIEQYAAHPIYKKKITYWVSEPDTGIYNAMNKGIRKATGEFCLFLNSGDWLVENTTLEKVLPEINGTADVYYSDMAYLDENLRLKTSFYPKKIDVNFFISGTLNHQNTLIKTSKLVEAGYYNEEYRICADWFFFLYIAWYSKSKFSKIPYSLSIYNRNGISSCLQTSSEREAEQTRGIHEVFKKLSPTIIELCSFRNSVYGNTIALFGESRFYIFYLKIYRYIKRRFYLLWKKHER